METPILRPFHPDETDALAELIHVSTNYYYVSNGKPPIFTCPPHDCRLFPDTYETLDPGCCLVAVHPTTHRLLGSCFYHPRPTHISVGIVNTHPSYFGQKIARRLLEHVLQIADTAHLPVRLVSSALNLDSFSLYTRLGFVPRQAFQDMFLAVPPEGIPDTSPHAAHIRPATLTDLPAIVSLEKELIGIEREQDYRFFLENKQNIWHLSVLENEKNGLEGFLASVAHPASNFLGPGVARTEAHALSLLKAALNHHRGRTPVFLIPVKCATLVQEMYTLGAKNCEIHFAQVRGEYPEPTGVLFPTFLPESG